MSVILNIVDVWQYYVCCIRSDVTRCTLFTMLYLYYRCQCGLQEMFWLHISIFMSLLASEPRSKTGFSFQSQCLSEMILLILYSMVWDWWVSRAGRMFFCCSKLHDPFISFSISDVFPFSFFSIGWYYGAVQRSHTVQAWVYYAVRPSNSFIFFNNLIIYAVLQYRGYTFYE